MGIRILLSFLTLSLAALSIFLPVKLIYWEDSVDVEAIGGLELEFPFTVPFYLLVLILSILYSFFTRFAGVLVVFILSCMLLPYAFLIWAVVEFAFFEVVKPGIGFYFIPLCAIQLFTLCLLRLIAVNRARNRTRRQVDLIDALNP